MKLQHVLLPLLVLATGCEELEPYTPKVNFQSLDVEEITFDDVDVDFVFSVDNPNPIDIGLSSFSYNLGFEEVDLLSGSNEDGFALEAVGSSELRLPVSMLWTDAWDTVQATRGLDTIGFGLDGHFGFDTPLGEARIPYDEGGEFPALRTPTFTLQRLKVTDLDLWSQTASLDIELGVDNDHGSTLFFDAFDYQLSLGNDQVASGLVSELGGVDGATEGALTLPVDIDLLNVGTATYSALTGRGDLNVGLDATMDVDTPFGILPLAMDESGNLSVE